MDIAAFRIIAPDRRYVITQTLALPSTFDFADATKEIKEGTWIKLVSGEAVYETGSEGDPTDTELTFPVLLGSGRMDVRQSMKITVAAYSNFVFEAGAGTYVSGTTYAVGDALTAEYDDGNRLILDKAASTNIILARVITPPVAGVNGLIAAYVGVTGTTV